LLFMRESELLLAGHGRLVLEENDLAA
jgi:hypothetical protein